MNISTKGMPREEWLERRQHFLGGSDSRKIFAPDDYGTALDVYHDKTSPVEITEPNQFMRRGIAFENYVSEQWAEQQGRVVVRDNKIRLADLPDKLGRPFLGASLDRLIRDTKPGIMEIKVTSKSAFDRWEGDIPPAHYFQIQHYYMVTKYTWAVLAVLTVEDWQIHSIPVAPDTELQELMQWKLERLWNENILERVPPDPQTVADVCRLYPSHVIGKTVEATSEDAEVLYQYRQYQEYEKTGKEGKEKIKSAIIPKMQDAEAMTLDGKILCTFKASKGGERFDVDKFAAENPDMYAQYLRTVPGSRRFLVK